MKKSILVLAIVGLLTGCGGGGGSTPPPTVFPLQTATKNLDSTGYQKTALISGTATDSAGTKYPVSGNISLSLSPSGTATFNGQVANVATISIVGSVTVSGQTVSLSETELDYVSSDFSSPLGFTTSTEYCVAKNPGSYPASVTIGQTGMIVTYSCYTSSSMSTPTGTESLSYMVSAGPVSNTATVSIIGSVVNTSGQQTSNSTLVYTIDTSGNISPISMSILGTSSGVTMNLTFTIQ